MPRIFVNHLYENAFTDDKRVYLPLYEAKMIHQFDHRWATYDGDDVRDMSAAEKHDPQWLVLPRYWVAGEYIEQEIGSTSWMIGFRDIARSTDERTAILSFLPRISSGNTLILVFLGDDLRHTLRGCFVANWNSMILDYVIRQKVAGTHLTYNYVRQISILPCDFYTPELLTFITARVLELTYTAWDLQPYARDVGYDGPPFIWNESRRFVIRCELDALYFHLYQISRDDTAYIMDSFPIVRRKDEAAYGYYRTKETILNIFDRISNASYVSPLDPPAGDPRAAYPP